MGKLSKISAPILGVLGGKNKEMNLREVKEKLEKLYPAGTEVRLVKMDDTQAPPVGTKGKVMHIDDAAQIHVAWETGSTLAVAYGEDVVERICYHLNIGYKNGSECVCMAYDYDALVTIALAMFGSVDFGKLQSESGSVIDRLYIETFDEDKDDNVTVWEYSPERRVFVNENRI